MPVPAGPWSWGKAAAGPELDRFAGLFDFVILLLLVLPPPPPPLVGEDLLVPVPDPLTDILTTSVGGKGALPSAMSVAGACRRAEGLLGANCLSGVSGAATPRGVGNGQWATETASGIT